MHSEDAVGEQRDEEDVNNQHLPKDSIYEPINPNSQEGRVNERIKHQKLISCSVKTLQEV